MISTCEPFLGSGIFCMEYAMAVNLKNFNLISNHFSQGGRAVPSTYAKNIWGISTSIASTIILTGWIVRPGSGIVLVGSMLGSLVWVWTDWDLSIGLWILNLFVLTPHEVWIPGASSTATTPPWETIFCRRTEHGVPWQRSTGLDRLPGWNCMRRPVSSANMIFTFFTMRTSHFLGLNEYWELFMPFPRSGLMVRRKYDQTVPWPAVTNGSCARHLKQTESLQPCAMCVIRGEETSYSTVATRSDPHHFPNHIDVKDADHYKEIWMEGMDGKRVRNPLIRL